MRARQTDTIRTVVRQTSARRRRDRRAGPSLPAGPPRWRAWAAGLLLLACLAGAWAMPRVLAPVLAPPAGPRPADPRAAALHLSSATLLDEVGRLQRPVPAGEVAAWRRALSGNLNRSKGQAKGTALLHVHAGEYALGHDQQPEQARRHFKQALALTGAKDPLHGLAAYDCAVARFYQGAYAEAADDFRRLLAPKTALPGYDPRTCALFLSHASACAGYHDEHAKIGVPEPPSLDPECGIASLAACLRNLSLPFDRHTLRSACRVTGEGSTMHDLLESAKNLGVSVYPVTGDEAGLKALPKPLVAFVERDHFVAVVRADRQGVSYLCSDCGAWPGGRVDLTWKQWRALNPGVYAVVARPHTATDRLLAALTSRPLKAVPVRLAFAGDLSRLHFSGHALLSGSLAALRGHVVRFGNVYWLGCGVALYAQHCAISKQCCPTDSSGPLDVNSPTGLSHAMAVGPTAGDPVNLATGEEEYTPAPDLTVYNPTGPSVSWGRIYNSLRPANVSNYEYDDFGGGWSQPYNVWVGDSGNHTAVPQLLPAKAASLGAGGSDAPASGLTWDVLHNGSTVATSASPSGWTVTIPYYVAGVTPPATATAGTGYELRYIDSSSSSSPTNRSAFFDVVPTASVPQGGSGDVDPDGTGAPASGLDWDILQGATTVATSASPGGWSASYSGGYGSTSGTFTITAPYDAALTGYTVRARYSSYPSGSATASAAFTVRAIHYTFGAGTKSIMMPNGGNLSFSAPSVPTAANSHVACSVEPGVAALVEWDYDAGYYSGHFVVTWGDRTKWVTQPFCNYGNGSFPLAQVIDPNGNAIRFVYGSLGLSYHPLLSSITDAAGAALLTISRGGSHMVTAVSDRYGRSVYYGQAMQPGYGPYGPPTSIPELGSVSQIVPTGTAGTPLRYAYGYEDVSNPEGESGFLFLHTITVPSPTGSGTSTATINYQTGYQFVSSVVDGNGNTRSYALCDASGNTTGYGYSGNYTKVTVADPLGNTVYSYVAGFDGNMNETSKTDGAGNAILTKTLSDPSDPYHSSSVTDGNGKITQYTWDSYGHLLTVTPPSNANRTPATISYTYSYTNFALGELTSMQEGSKTATSYTYYEPSGLVHTVNSPTPGTAGSGQTVTTTYTYDGLGNLLTMTAPGNNAATTITTTYNYIQDGPYSQSAAISQPLTVTDNLGKIGHYRYDARGNVTVLVDSLGNEYDSTFNIADQVLSRGCPPTNQTGAGRIVDTYSYLYPDGSLMGHTIYDESGIQVRQIRFGYGLEGEQLSITGSTEPVSYTYDASYRLATQADANNNATHYYYNKQKYLDGITLPGYNGPTPLYDQTTGTWSNIAGRDSIRFPHYDAKGQVLQRIDGNGRETDYLYSDPESRLTEIQYPTNAALNVHYTYDSYGRRATMLDSTETNSYNYDDLNNLNSDTTSFINGPQNLTINYTYYPDGDSEQISTPAGSFAYSDDADGRMSTLTNPLGETSRWTYDDNGLMQTQTLNNGVVTTYTRNARGQIIDLLTRTASGGALSDFGAIQFDAAGNCTSVTATLSTAPANYSGVTTYTYDAKNQLVQEGSQRQGSYAEGFGYDAAGNATTFRGSTEIFNPDNQSTSLTYDGNGNPTNYRGNLLAYDPENRMTFYGTVMASGYNGDGLRTWRQTVNSGRIYFMYEGTHPICELDASGAVRAVNTVGADGLLSRHTGNGSVFYSFDLQGNVAQRLDAGGNVISSDEYDAFGSRITTAVGSTDPFAYEARAGYYSDTEAGIVLLSYRYYDPSTGRFLTRDPIGYNGGINLYGYVRNNPGNARDPSGLAPGFVGIGNPRDLNEASIAMMAKKGGKPPSRNPGPPPKPSNADCSDANYDFFSRKKYNACDERGGEFLRCNEDDCCDDLKKKMKKAYDCWKARLDLDDICFDCGDEGHRVRRQQPLDNLNDCLRQFNDPKNDCL